jgi:cyclase
MTERNVSARSRLRRAAGGAAWAALAMAAGPVCGQLGSGADEIRLTVLDFGRGFHVITAPAGVIAGNVAVSIGDQGVLIVDDFLAHMVPALRARVRELGGGDIPFAINTHWHFDHADGNQVLGPDGTWIVAHENSRRMMTVDNRINLVNTTIDQPAYPMAALPVIAFDASMQFHFNGERIDLKYYGPAHTSGDLAVFFRGRNAVHLGDVFNNSGYPFIDADNGGSLNGIIRFCESVLTEIDAGTIVIPGHGPVADRAALEAYTTMLTTIRDRIAALVGTGATLQQVIAARPTAEWDDRLGNPAMFIDRAYTSLTREAAAR